MHDKCLIRIYKTLPFPIAVTLSRWRPNLAFYINSRNKELVINDFLGEYIVNINMKSDIERRMLSRTYEPESISIINLFVKPGQVCFDIGANVGPITLALAQAVGSGGRVESFEPSPLFFDRLCRNLALNPSLSGRVFPHQFGFSDEPSELLWQEAPRDPGNGTIHWADPTRPGIGVPVTTLDAFVVEQGYDSLHFLKIDVEGMERRVLTGGLETIRRFRPVIFFPKPACATTSRKRLVVLSRN